MRLLHIGFTIDIHYDIMYICKKLKIKTSFHIFEDGTKGKYNIGKERANNYFKKHREYFETFDIILVSDTAPIARVFLENNWNKKLLIWIHNRFDYGDAATNDCNFPDPDYYELIKEETKKFNVKIFGNTYFENYYCKKIRNTDIGNKIINNLGIPKKKYELIPQNIIWYTHNNMSVLKLDKKMKDLGIPIQHKNFNDTNRYQNVIHIPDNWTNNYLFEALNLGICYFIPTHNFFRQIIKDTGFYWSPPFNIENLEMSEWYKNDKWFIYFDSWEDLKDKILNEDYTEFRLFLKEEGEKHKMKNIEEWKNMIF